MHAAWYERNGSAREVLQLGTLPTPEPAAGEVRVRLHASGVNPSDVKSRARRPLAGPRVIPHSDGAGVIEAVGPGVAADRVGERVWVWNGQWQRPHGTAATHIALPAGQAVALPAAVSFDEGACLGIPALTALQAVRLAALQPGDTVLVIGAGNAVGHYVTQLAARAGARVIGTAGAAARQAAAREAGAHAVIDRRIDVAAAVKDLTGGRGADAVIDMDFSGTAPLLTHGVLRAHGRLIGYGSNEPGTVGVDFRTLLFQSLTLRFFVVYELTPADRLAVIGALQDLLAAGALRHRVGAVMPLADIAAAHEAVESGAVVGQVVLRP